MLQVRDVLMNCQLTPLGWQPVVAIDECQVLDEVFGWGGFRSSFPSPCLGQIRRGHIIW